MRWFTFAILLVFFLTLQTAVSAHFELLGARPNWLLILVVFVAFHAQQRDAILGGWCIGFCADLMSIERLGVIALTYGLIAWAIVSLRDAIFRYRWTTQLLTTWLAGMLVQTGWVAYGTAMYGADQMLISAVLWHILGNSLYTAIWAPPVHFVLQRVGRSLGFKMPRYSYRGLQQVVSR